MNVTKIIAKEVAVLLTKKLKEKADWLEIDLKNSVTSMYKISVPEIVVKISNDMPEWFRYRNTVIVQGNGFSYQHVSTTENVICKADLSYPILTPTPEQAKILIDLKTNFEDANKNYSEVLQEIEQALISLRTYKKVEENFPEAFIHLPNKIPTSLTVNLSDIRNKIK